VVLSLLRYQRESFVRKVDGLSDEEARRALVPSGTTLLWLTKHLACAEQIWILQRFAGQDVVLDNEVHTDDTLAAAVTAYRAVWPTVDAVAGAHDMADEIPDPNGGPVPVTLRWILVHLVEEVARHAGHADILRELLDGETGR
jgi:hypothetical protein